MEKFAQNVRSVAVNITFVGFGQGGCRQADRAASIKDADGRPLYNVLAFNSNDGDFDELKHINPDNFVSLGLGGLGKNPEYALSVLEKDKNAKETIKRFVSEKIRPDDDLVVFLACPGGTGASTILKAAQEFNDYHNNNKVKAILKKFKEQADDFEENINMYKKLAFQKAQEHAIKIAIIFTLPVRSDGPDILRQINGIATRIWTESLKPTRNIPFVIYPDNQWLFEHWQKDKENRKTTYDNYRDYANEKIIDVLHELNAGTAIGGTAVTFDIADFRRVILEGYGNLVIGKTVKNAKDVRNTEDIVNMFKEAANTPILHQPVKFEVETENGKEVKAVHHAGVFGVIPKGLDTISSSFIDEAKDAITNILPLKGTVFYGYLERLNNFNCVAYTFYKTLALPYRLQSGLVHEYQEFMEKTKSISSQAASIEQIAAAKEDIEDFDLDIDLSDLGIEEPKKNKEKLSIDDIDLSDLDLD